MLRHLSYFDFFFFKQKTAYEIMPSLVGSEMCIRDRGYKCNFRDRTVGYYCCTGISSNCVGTLHRKIKFDRKEQCGEQRSYLPDSFLYISKFQEEVFVGRDGKRPGREQICFIQTLFQDIP